jgi:hypothetical protein
MTCRRCCFLSLLLALAAVGAGAWADTAPALPPAASRTVDFKRDIYPILAERCFECHKGSDATSGYRLDQRADILGETDGKVLARSGDSAASRLIQLVASQVPNKRMPAKGKPLDAEQIGLLRAWIDQGLKWDESVLPVERPQSKHWAFQVIRRPALPRVANAGWVRTPVDAFIAASHDAKRLTPAPEASRRALVRRLYLDLIGLPPTPEEMAALLADRSTDWYERLVDKLLASPHYGERWGRHWLDLARYADSEGYESDHTRPYAWRYRDYVINAFNSDKPYDRFLREQIAGDEIEPYSDENLIATGFLACARLSSNEEDRPRQRNDVLVDIVNATGNAILGLTINCCQCHNHKFDPLAARDYYRFQGFFVKGASNNLTLKAPDLWQAYESTRLPEYEPALKLRDTILAGARTRLTEETRKTLTPEERAARDVPEEKRTPEQAKLAREVDLKFQFLNGQIERAIPEEDRKLYDELKKKLAAMEKKMPDKPQTFGFYSPATSPTHVDVLPMKGFYPPPYVPAELAKAKPHILVAGEVHQRGPALDVGWPALFGSVPAAVEKKPRSVLVDWLANPQNPLTARVWANRIWHYHFGRGIVATPSDFGTRGAAPTHPELLDWLASELMQSGWSAKHLHRLIVCSSTYRQSAENNAANRKIDPENLLWWHWPLRRLESETIRDATLAVTGELDHRLGGPGAEDEKTSCRTVYLFQRRSRGPMMQKLFDSPTAANESCPCRHVSTVPLQALYLMNNEFALQRAKVLAERVQARAAGDDRDRQVELVFQLLLSRPPDEMEKALAAKFFASHRTSEDGTPALVHFCQALLNVNEFVYLE